ncbi:manganese efflux pump MntP [Salipaludibacillus agaradhaerens]|uniref:manganese efflux pump MntP n=1 Tax=Salipaludibacillus agaradhaerens TaxID=76935 RepID=UPI001FE8D2A5|nr:manganese efflux pump [Salipaludibacillus agaradhaerens]
MSDLVTVALMALALSMDAFSISVGIGLLGMRYKRIVLVSATVGFFHMIMPVVGIIIGRLLSEYMGALAFFIGGSGLIVLGMQMIISSVKKEPSSLFSPIGTGLVVFAMSVSMDSLSLGLTLGVLGVNTWLISTFFGVASAFFTGLGLMIGKKAGYWLGTGGEWIGGFVLLIFGVKMILTPF